MSHSLKNHASVLFQQNWCNIQAFSKFRPKQHTYKKKGGSCRFASFVSPCSLGGAPRQAQDTRPLACVTPDAAATAQWTTRAVSVRIQFHENSRGFVSRNRRAGRTSRRPPLADIRFTKNERYSFHIFIFIWHAADHIDLSSHCVFLFQRDMI